MSLAKFRSFQNNAIVNVLCWSEKNNLFLSNTLPTSSVSWIRFRRKLWSFKHYHCAGL